MFYKLIEHKTAFFHVHNFTKLLRKKQGLFVEISILFSDAIVMGQKICYTFVNYPQGADFCDH